MSYLAKFEYGAPEVEQLKQWLRGFITRPDYLTNPAPPPLPHLRTALILACREISQTLDLQMESVIRAAQQPDSCIEVEENDFWASRIIDFDGMLEHNAKDIRAMEQEDVIAFLEASKDEIAWIQNEMRRLDVHIDNARDAVREGRRKGFTYRPTPREKKKGGEEVLDDAREKRRSPPRAGSGDVDGRKYTTPERRLDEEGEVKSEEDRRDSGGGGGDAAAKSRRHYDH